MHYTVVHLCDILYNISEINFVSTALLRTKGIMHGWLLFTICINEKLNSFIASEVNQANFFDTPESPTIQWQVWALGCIYSMSKLSHCAVH